MTLPGFTAEVAPRAPAAAYASISIGGLGGGVVAAAFGRLNFPVIRCCRRAPLLGNRFVCTQRYQLPWESCTCIATQTGPIFICKDNGLSSFEPA